MMNGTMQEGGLGKLAQYGSFYMTVTAGLLTCAGALAALAYGRYRCRAPEFREIAKTASTAFSLSSSAATMPVTKESLRNIGVSERTTNSVVPLGANFNMMGTSLYLGVVASCASAMLGQDPGLAEKAAAMLTVVLTAFGAPGAPASTIIFLDPVLAKLGLTGAQAQKIYEMVLPADRLFDMGQTALNVTGDMAVAMEIERAETARKAAAPAPAGAKPLP
jgi:Na+/H+-dicarboxylate symporter